MAAVRRALGTKRVGHTGTLDPFATGLLIVLVNRATRLSRFVVGHRKTYTGTIRLGLRTATEDPTGEVVATSDAWRELDAQAISVAMVALTGHYAQRPPVYSAIKVGGQRAYKRARRGEGVELEPREVHVHEFQLTGHDGTDVRFRCDVSGGTYVRALARDLGDKLECGAHLSELRRETIHDFSVSDALTLDDVERADEVLRRPAELVRHLPRMTLDDEMHTRVRHGRPLPASGAAEPMVALCAGDELVAVAERSGDLLKPRVVLEG